MTNDHQWKGYLNIISVYKTILNATRVISALHFLSCNKLKLDFLLLTFSIQQ